MTTPQEFLEAFFRQKATIYAEANTHLEPVYREYFDGPLLERAEDFLLRDRQVVAEVAQSDSSTTVITVAHFKSAEIRQRYHLSVFGQSWKIMRIERECFLCRGIGLLGSKVCHNCKGEGWCDKGRNGG